MSEVQVASDFIRATGVKMRTGVVASGLTTFCIGGPIEYLVEPNSVEELSRAIMFLRSQGVGWRVVGNGSNLLVSSSGVSGWYVKLGQGFRFLGSEGDARFSVGASYGLMTLSRDLSSQGFAGLEFAGGIPASIGGATRMNAGAYGGQMADVLKSVTCVNGEGRIVTLNSNELTFGYRHNSLPQDMIVCSVELALRSADKVETDRRRAAFLAERSKKQPLQHPSAGSIFRNPESAGSAGALIEECGLKGKVAGGAKISELHANWILNEKRTACHADVMTLISICQERVQEKFGVTLKPEIVVWA